MAVDSFRPEVWAAAIITTLDEKLTYGTPGVTNRDYEGDISEYGGTVRINSAADPAIVDYVPYTPMTSGAPTTTSQLLEINQRKAWVFDLDDVDAAQVRNDGELISKLTARAAHKLALTADAYVAGLMAAEVAPGAEVAADATNAYELLVDLGTELTENDVPQAGRWVVVPPAFHGLLQKDQRFVSSGDDRGAVVRSEGVVGRAAGLDVLVSNQVPEGPGATAGGYLVIAGHGMATTFAQQISKTEAVRTPDMFVDRMRGLHVYGAKVVRPEALAARDVTIS
ncbi:phage major capsid protein [Saccharomonospora cyanea]|uniref:p22 coat protein n=1 Tax=Saccharomonospora cyanea NA-134 TaxID=882082 RepID=H5XEY2_9PSEU|nr:hypothetical protein [Saccharomonospora cyanea]EHR60376.1 P22 coat protein [Saccharomonospora cyanea NA-134]